MRTPIEVVNLALARLSKDPIVDLDENTDRANAVRPIWAISLHLFLNESEWSFARSRKSPARLSVDAEAIRPFCFAYALPEDCIKLIDVVGWEQRIWRRVLRHPDYSVSLCGDSPKQAVLCNADNIQIEYITTRVNLVDFSPDAIDALACRVAVECALAQDNSSQRGKQLMEFYEMAVAKAKKNDIKKEPPKRLGGDVYSRVRL